MPRRRDHVHASRKQIPQRVAGFVRAPFLNFSIPVREYLQYFALHQVIDERGLIANTEQGFAALEFQDTNPVQQIPQALFTEPVQRNKLMQMFQVQFHGRRSSTTAITTPFPGGQSRPDFGQPPILLDQAAPWPSPPSADQLPQLAAIRRPIPGTAIYHPRQSAETRGLLRAPLAIPGWRGPHENGGILPKFYGEARWPGTQVHPSPATSPGTPASLGDA